MLGALLALLSAASFALTNALFRRGAATGSVGTAMMITVPLGALAFLGVVGAAGMLPLLAELPLLSIALFACAGILHFVGGRYCNFRAIKAVGTMVAGPVVDSGIVWTMLLALVLLEERVSLVAGLGIVLIVVGPSLALGRNKLPKRLANGVAPNYREGLTFGLLAALCFGLSPILIGFAMPAAGGLAFGLLGGMISYAAAALVVLLPVLVIRQRVASPPPSGSRRWFVLSGLMISLSHMTRYMALAVAPVSIVVPLLRTAIMFRVLFAWLVNRQSEVMTRPMLLATIICGAGVALIAIGL